MCVGAAGFCPGLCKILGVAFPSVQMAPGASGQEVRVGLGLRG